MLSLSVAKILIPRLKLKEKEDCTEIFFYKNLSQHLHNKHTCIFRATPDEENGNFPLCGARVQKGIVAE